MIQRITGVWISPDHRYVAVQLDKDQLTVLDFWDTQPDCATPGAFGFGEIPVGHDWTTVLDTDIDGVPRT